MRSGRYLLGATFLVACVSHSEPFEVDGYRYDSERFVEWRLPRSLRELSGLTADERGRLFGHDDERAIVYQIDYEQGRFAKRFSFGRPPVSGDFEGIAWMDGELVLTTSDGDLYIGAEGEDRQAVPYRLVRTGLGALCEIEGLDWVPAQRVLLFACKTPRVDRLEDRVSVLAWSLDDEALDEARSVSIPLARVQEHADLRRVAPSGIARSPVSGALLLVAGRQRALLAVSSGGERLAGWVFERAAGTQQMEGIAMLPDGKLIIGSEGDAHGYLRVYQGER
jgi:uncharacterized protein YjiK